MNFEGNIVPFYYTLKKSKSIYKFIGTATWICNPKCKTSIIAFKKDILEK